MRKVELRAADRKIGLFFNVCEETVYKPGLIDQPMTEREA